MIFIVPIVVLIAGALYIDIRNRKVNNQTSINPNAKPGEDCNYMMGDNRYLNGSN